MTYLLLRGNIIVSVNSVIWKKVMAELTRVSLELRTKHNRFSPTEALMRDLGTDGWISASRGWISVHCFRLNRALPDVYKLRIADGVDEQIGSTYGYPIYLFRAADGKVVVFNDAEVPPNFKKSHRDILSICHTEKEMVTHILTR